jgi:hypothetical protein
MDRAGRYRPLELVVALVALSVMVVAVITDNDQVRDAHWQAAPPPALQLERAPSLAESAKPLVYPVPTVHWP